MLKQMNQLGQGLPRPLREPHLPERLALVFDAQRGKVPARRPQQGQGQPGTGFRQGIPGECGAVTRLEEAREERVTKRSGTFSAQCRRPLLCLRGREIIEDEGGIHEVESPRKPCIGQ